MTSSDGRAVLLATVATAAFATLFAVFERQLLWMLVILIPPLWIPILMSSTSPAAKGRPGLLDATAFGAALVGLLVLGVVTLLR